MNRTNRIATNTVILYIQLIVVTILGLLSTRYVLKALGEEGYGIYMLVAGVVTMLNVLTSAMSNTSMRFMAYSLGKGDLEESKKTFNSTMLIHFVIGGFLVLFLEIGGCLMFDYVLNIPPERMSDAKLIYQFMVVTTFVAIISVPYDAVINSHENLLFLSIVTIIETILKLALALWLIKAEVNKLVWFGLILMLIQILARIIKQVYSNINYPECKLHLRSYDKSVIKSIMSFTGWDFLGTLASFCSTQLRGIIINMFFGVKLNAAEGIGKKVNAQLNMVSVSITKAITPQMNKNEGKGNRGDMIMLAKVGAKYTSFLFAIVAVPVFIEANYLLHLWLDKIPAFTVIFCQMCLLIQFTGKLTWQISNAIRAVGRIKEYQLMQSIISILGIIIAFLCFKYGAQPVCIYIVELFSTILIGIFTLYYGEKIVGILPLDYINTTILTVILPVIAGVIASVLLYYGMEQGLFRFLLIFLCNSIVVSVCFYYYGVTPLELEKIKGIVISFNKKIVWKN